MKYDVIIVGAGSSGCVLAARLSEDPKRSVLLLEAGPDYPDLERLPDDLRYADSPMAYVPGAPHNWSFVGTATPEQGQPMEVARGKVVGGSSAINGQILLRGAPEDFDSWAQWGNHEWAFPKVLPYFRKLETDTDAGGDFHGSDGPIPVQRDGRRVWPQFQEAFRQACAAAGFHRDPDMNSPEATGLGVIPENVDKGIRMSTALTYINPIRHRPNLTIRAGVLATRLLLSGRKAAGVEAESGGEGFSVEGEEIILAAGAIGSPQLLMLSGVGPTEHLRSLGISTVNDLPGVGQNLRDHPWASVQWHLKGGFQGEPEARELRVALRYAATSSDHRNDMQVLPSSTSPMVEGDPMKGEGVGLNVALYVAASAGELMLQSTDPQVQPRLDYRYLSDPWDRERMREGVSLCLRLGGHEAYRDILGERIAPTDQEISSDGALDAWLLRNVGTAQHISGTCKMGPDSDPRAVVDQYCRVHGMEALRVVDASVMPDLVRANTNATVIMVGERAADLIKGD